MGASGTFKLWTVVETAELLRVSKQTVYRLIYAGRLPAVRVGGSLRIDRAALERFVAEGATDGPE